MAPFQPFFRNRHLATIAANFWPRDYPTDLFPSQVELIQTEPEVRVLTVTQRPQQPSTAHVILLHGLEGSHESGYMVSLAQTLLRSGMTVTRLNMRTCGGSEAYCKTLYHAGLTTDLAAVVQSIRTKSDAPVFIVGYSLGGNVVLKFAGESRSSLRVDVAGVVTISTPIDLGACCRQMMKPENFLYQRRFVARLKDRYRRRHRQHPDVYSLDGLDRIRSVYAFDHHFTARYFRFGSADNYYSTQSANQFLDGIAVPALLIQAQDDPLIPFDVYRHPAFEANPCLQLLATQYGGHVGFVSRELPRFWVDHTVSAWIDAQRNKLP